MRGRGGLVRDHRRCGTAQRESLCAGDDASLGLCGVPRRRLHIDTESQPSECTGGDRRRQLARGDRVEEFISPEQREGGSHRRVSTNQPSGGCLPSSLWTTPPCGGRVARAAASALPVVAGIGACDGLSGRTRCAPNVRHAPQTPGHERGMPRPTAIGGSQGVPRHLAFGAEGNRSGRAPHAPSAQHTPQPRSASRAMRPNPARTGTRASPMQRVGSANDEGERVLRPGVSRGRGAR